MSGESVYIGLGSNLGDRHAHLAGAVAALSSHAQIDSLRASRAWESEPWGDADQPRYLNAVAQLHTTLPPLDLLDLLFGIERAHGRVRASDRRNGPRTLDLDLLLYGARVIDLPQLCVPHPRLAQRAFVLLPLAELAPQADVPGLGAVQTLLQPGFASLCWRADGVPPLA